MSAAAVADRRRRRRAADRGSGPIAEAAPTGRHRRPTWTRSPLSLRPASVVAADADLRRFADFLAGRAPRRHRLLRRHRPAPRRGLQGVAGGRVPGRGAAARRPTPSRPRLGTLRMFFDRIIEWDWADAPARTPIFAGDLPASPTSRCPSSSTTPSLRPVHAGRRGRGPAADPPGASSCWPAPACASASCAPWRPTRWCSSARPTGCGSRVGKLHNDRYIPLHPQLVDAAGDVGADPRRPRHRAAADQRRAGRSTATR